MDWVFGSVDNLGAPAGLRTTLHTRCGSSTEAPADRTGDLCTNKKEGRGVMSLWLVRWIGFHDGLPCMRVYYTEHHAEQFARALRLNGVPNVTVMEHTQ